MSSDQPTRDELRKLAENATLGPWEAAPTKAWGDEYVELTVQPVTESWDSDPAHACCEPLSPADAEFIAAARTALPALLDQLDQAEARIKAVQDVLDEPDAMIGASLHVSVDRIRRALEA